MQYNFQTLAKTGKLSGIDHKLDAQKAQKWFRSQATDVSYVNPKKFQGSGGAFQNMDNLSENSIGKMYFFSYDPKWKEKLPYYDTYPLVFPIDFQSDRMLGLNMHYLSPFLRARLMDALYTTMNNKKWDKTTQLQINYGILKSAVKFKYFKPTIHSYLFSHVQSQFRYIPPNMWDYTLLLPLARFKKQSEPNVWTDSMMKV